MSRQDQWVPQRIGTHYTIKSLRLDLKAAIDGKTWLLLPEGYRDRDSGVTYPLPSRREELQKLAVIPIPPWADKQDCGCHYIRRAMDKWKKKQQKMNSALLDSGRRAHQIAKKQYHFNEKIKHIEAEAREALEKVRVEAAKQIASLNDLFALGREGIEGQMRAYLNNEEYQGEKINKRDFQTCFRMVTQAVKGLGMPSDQRPKATDAIMQELAASLKSTQTALAMSKTDEQTDEKPN